MSGPIGVFDSGHGGLTTLAALRARLPDRPFVYLGDHANAPYGVRSPAEIAALTQAGVERLFAEGCELVILACNTAAAVALRGLQEGWLAREHADKRVLGVFVPVIEALTGRPWAADGPPVDLAGLRIAVFATPATVASGAFPRELAFRARGVEVKQVACPGLVDALEEGRHTEAQALARGFAQQAATARPERAFLGCTHYPLVRDAFAAGLPESVEILSQPDLVAASLADYLQRHPRRAGHGAALTCLTSGDPEAVSAAARALTGEDYRFHRA